MAKKIMLYSHDSWGLGHLRRSLAIAHQINRAIPETTCLIATGSPVATSFPLDAGVEIMKLPSVTKDNAGRYQSRQLRSSYSDLLKLRRGLLDSAFEHFRPDLLIVDHQLIGLDGELLPVLQRARSEGTRCIYGMREVLDSGTVTERGWANQNSQWALQQAYDEIWIYGDRERFDTVAAYPSLAAASSRITFTGLIQNGQSGNVGRSDPRHQVLVTAGGGEDGAQLLLAYAQGLVQSQPAWHSTIVAGPLMSAANATRLEQMLRPLRLVTYHRFHQCIADLLHNSDAVVSMAGYNSCAEIIAARCPAILVPRTAPRQEQLIRARYLENCGAATTLLSPRPDTLMKAVALSLADNVSIAARYPRCDGLAVVSARVRNLLHAGPTPADLITADSCGP